MTTIYTNYNSLQKVVSSITTPYCSFKHAAHMRNLQLHDHSDKARLLSMIIILNPQYMSTNRSEGTFQYYFTISALVIHEVHSI